MTNRMLTRWDAAVKKRRAAILRLISKFKLAKGKTKDNINNAMHYGVMDRHQLHWHKINGVCVLNSVRSRRLRK